MVRTHNKRIKMCQICQENIGNYSRNFRGLPTYESTYTKIKKLIFSFEIPKLVDDIGIIFNDFQSRFYSTFKIRVKLIWVKFQNFRISTNVLAYLTLFQIQERHH